ncbi:FAD binding domain-containing protein [Paenibacillus sp.]|uniref:FAD binding domain-containing protein n=1 Tax=Paenibacillus sp. TaxID=58172 RepID=UPI00282DCE9E|nr:FAD binding domain-containing protein [Paenibacillus sp.]MDR0267474.1 FAD binding domain-containing protein [Paenibacillus sp.]
MPLEYLVPESLDEAIQLLHQHPGEITILSGGQVVINKLRTAQIMPDKLMDIGEIPELQQVEIGVDNIWLGGNVTHATLSRHSKLRSAIPGLVQMALAVGDQQIRNRATVGGTVANGDSLGDYWPLLLAVGGHIHLHSYTGKRQVAFNEWLQGRHKIVCNEGEIVVGIKIHHAPQSLFHKHVFSNLETLAIACVSKESQLRVVVAGLTELPIVTTASGRFEIITNSIHEALSNQSIGIHPYKIHMAHCIIDDLLAQFEERR